MVLIDTQFGGFTWVSKLVGHLQVAQLVVSELLKKSIGPYKLISVVFTWIKKNTEVQRIRVYNYFIFLLYYLN